MIPIEIRYCRTKSLSFRARDGKVSVKAPYSVARDRVEREARKFSQKYYAQLISQQSHVLSGNRIVRLLGKPVFLFLDRNLDVPYVRVHENCIRLRPDQEALDLLCYDVLMPRLIWSCRHYSALFATKAPSKIRIKPVSSYWGKCFPARREVSFRTALAFFDPDTVDAIVAHEMAHFLVASHQKKFYDELLKRMPDYRERLEKLQDDLVWRIAISAS